VNKHFFHLLIALSLSFAPTAGMAQENATTGGAESTAAPPEPPIANQLRMPKLSIKWACQDCAINDKVPPLIETAYAQEAVANGQVVSDTDTAEVAITHIRQRPPGARVMFGAFSGKDELFVRVSYQGKERIVEDYFANAWVGMNGLAESVGKQIHQQVLSIIQPEQKTN
jgi:hypothetical protein